MRSAPLFVNIVHFSAAFDQFGLLEYSGFKITSHIMTLEYSSIIRSVEFRLLFESSNFVRQEEATRV